MLAQMKSEGIEPNTGSYNCALNGLAKRREWYRARRLFRKMVGEGLSPDAKSYNGLVEAAGMGSLSPRQNMIQVTIQKNIYERQPHGWNVGTAIFFLCFFCFFQPSPLPPLYSGRAFGRATSVLPFFFSRVLSLCAYGGGDELQTLFFFFICAGNRYSSALAGVLTSYGSPPYLVFVSHTCALSLCACHVHVSRSCTTWNRPAWSQPRTRTPFCWTASLSGARRSTASR